MSDVKRWTHHVTWDGELKIQATMMALRSDGEYVLASDYAALEAELATVKKVAYGNMELLEENQNLQAELARLRAGQEPVNRAHIMDALLMWNRRHEAPPIKVGYEYGVAGAVLDLIGIAPQQSAVPDDYLIVPIQPTEEMRKRAQDYLAAEGMIVSDWLVHTAYTEMLAAAPSAPATVQGDGWIPVSERLPQIKQVLSEKCTIEGREIPTLYRSGMVLTFDGSRVSAGIVEWFHSKSPLNNVTHWMPLPAAPAIAAARQEGGKV